MLCRKIKGVTTKKSTLKNTDFYRYFAPAHYSTKQCLYQDIFNAVNKTHRPGRNMSFKFIWKDLSAARLWSVWTRSYLISTVVKRCRRERTVKEVLQCFRHTFLRPRRTLLLAATAAYHRGEDEPPPTSCDSSITDEDLKAVLTELAGVEELSRRTLFCACCGNRLLIDKKQPGVHYCTCNNGSQQPESLDGWVPYMEAEDVIIWRKEYKPGQGLYAYKVYGRYGEVRAADFAAVQVDGAYRREWDAAVASLSVVERRANGLPDQAVLHWEVLWPRLFANRDYVYIRRHKEYEVKSPPQPHRVGLFPGAEGAGGAGGTPAAQHHEERPSVHSNAKRKAMESYNVKQRDSAAKDNKVYVIISRSCEHPKVPVSKHAIRVSEYWSHMVIKTLDGADKTGMEFVLTYYDEPAVGGLPHGVATWATGRAAPAYLQRMRAAALHYDAARTHRHEDLPDFTPFIPTNKSNEEDEESSRVSEEEMESSKQGPELNGNNKQAERATRDRATQTDASHAEPSAEPSAEPRRQLLKQPSPAPCAATPAALKSDIKESPSTLEEDNKSPEENNGSWWRYLYPFYYFV